MQSVTRRTLGGLSVIRRAAAGGAVSCASRRSYHDNIVEHYENPRNVGSLDKKDKLVGTVSRSALHRERLRRSHVHRHTRTRRGDCARDRCCLFFYFSGFWIVLGLLSFFHQHRQTHKL